MERFLVTGLACLLFWGCQQPSDVQLTQDEYETDLEVRSVVVPDTNVVVSSVDSSAILPGDQLQFRAFFLVNNVTIDAGQAKASFSFARVFVADSAVRFKGQTLGHHGMDLGMVRLNGELMLKIPHLVMIKRWPQPDSVVFSGVEYLKDLTGLYQPDHPYRWSVTGPGPGNVSPAIRSPDNLVVHSPAGGSVLSREKDLALRWTGARGKLSIVISTFDPWTRRTRPLLELRSRANSGRALLPAKLLRQLPRASRFYLFTFILANRNDTIVLQQVAGKVVVQAASVYNSYVELL
jgi:hypothetical protein